MLDKWVILDTENSGAIRNKAHPFDPRNKLLLAGVRSSGRTAIYDVEYSQRPYGDHLLAISDTIRSGSWLVGFNIKYDLHWLRRYNIQVGQGIKIWDCQLAEFILSRQLNAYPSLEDSCRLRQVTLKKGTMTEYIDRGIDVSDIPLPELTEYLEGDLISTEELFWKQQELIKEAGLWNLFRLHCQDLVVLADMEWNGMKYDVKRSLELAEECSRQEQLLVANVNEHVPELVREHFNWNSGDHISWLLYGGKGKFDYKVENGVYKTGIKTGQTRYSWRVLEYDFPRLVEPLKGSKLKKDGFFGTGEDVLKGLKARGKAKSIIDATLGLAELSKLRGTYYEGIPNKMEELGWEDELVHGNINQCVAVTGRTSSSNPNLQNQPKGSKECFVTRFS